MCTYYVLSTNWDWTVYGLFCFIAEQVAFCTRHVVPDINFLDGLFH